MVLYMDMKKILFILMIFCFASTQAMALNCGVNCAVGESLKKQTKDHSCCHAKKDKKEKKSSSRCMDEVNSACFHELASDNISPKTFNDITSKVVFLKELPILSVIKLTGIHNSYRSKIPDGEFLKYKASLDLYILNAQFLI